MHHTSRGSKSLLSLVTFVLVGTGVSALSHCNLDSAKLDDLEEIAKDAGIEASVELDYDMHFERYDSVENKFEVLTPPAKERIGFYVLSSGEKVYLIGGLTEGITYTKTVEIYDTTTQTWSRGADWPNPRGAWILPVAGLFCAIGGSDSANIFQGVPDVECYDPATDAWSIRKKMPQTIDTFYPAATEDKIYILGGAINTNSSFLAPKSFAYSYDVKNDTWATETSLPSPRSASAVQALDGKLYVLGGFSKTFDSDATDTTEEDLSMLRYDPSTKEWDIAPQMPGRALFGSDVASGELITFFGLSDNLIDRYNPTDESWTAGQDPAASLSAGVYVAVVHEGDLYTLVLADKVTVQGATPSLESSGKLWRYSMADNTWEMVAQRSKFEKDAAFMGTSLGQYIYYAGAYTPIQASSSAQ